MPYKYVDPPGKTEQEAPPMKYIIIINVTWTEANHRVYKIIAQKFLLHWELNPRSMTYEDSAITLSYCDLLNQLCKS